MSGSKIVVFLFGLIVGIIFIALCCVCSFVMFMMFGIMSIPYSTLDYYDYAPPITSAPSTNNSISSLYKDIPALSADQKLEDVITKGSVVVEVRRDKIGSGSCQAYAGITSMYKKGQAIPINCGYYSLDSSGRLVSIEKSSLKDSFEIRQIDFLTSTYKKIDIGNVENQVFSAFSENMYGYLYFVAQPCSISSKGCLYKYDTYLGSLREFKLDTGVYVTAGAVTSLYEPLVSPQKDYLLVPYNSLGTDSEILKAGFQIYNTEGRLLDQKERSVDSQSVTFEWKDNDTVLVKDQNGLTVFEVNLSIL